MGQIKSIQEQVQEIVEKAINAVEEQHKAVAEASFGYAEKLYNVDAIKAKHDDVASLAYKKARDVNKFVGEYAGDIIAKFEKDVAATEKTVTKKVVAKKKAAATAVKEAAEAQA